MKTYREKIWASFPLGYIRFILYVILPGQVCLSHMTEAVHTQLINLRLYLAVETAAGTAEEDSCILRVSITDIVSLNYNQVPISIEILVGFPYQLHCTEKTVAPKRLHPELFWAVPVGNVLPVTRWLILSSAYKSWQSMMVSHRAVDQLHSWDSFHKNACHPAPNRALLHLLHCQFHCLKVDDEQNKRAVITTYWQDKTYGLATACLFLCHIALMLLVYIVAAHHRSLHFIALR